jgi:hypothetical protein
LRTIRHLLQQIAIEGGHSGHLVFTDSMVSRFVRQLNLARYDPIAL